MHMHVHVRARRWSRPLKEIVRGKANLMYHNRLIATCLALETMLVLLQVTTLSESLTSTSTRKCNETKKQIENEESDEGVATMSVSCTAFLLC